MSLFQCVDDGSGIEGKSGDRFDKWLEYMINPGGCGCSDATMAGDDGSTCECVFVYLW